MYLSLVRNSLFILFLFIPYGFCEEIAIGEAYYSRDISENECYDLAKMEAEKKIMSNAGFEHVRFFNKDICSETNEGSNCKLFQDSMVYYDGGFISEKSFFNNEISGEGNNRICRVSIKANVTKYASQPDPSFIFKAELEKNNLRANEEIRIIGETKSEAYIYLFSLVDNNDEFIKLFPNNLDKDNKISGEFQIPSSTGQKKYGLKAIFPVNVKKKIVPEYMVIVASKKEMKFFDTEKKMALYRRLNDYKRENWKMENLGYVIFKDE